MLNRSRHFNHLRMLLAIMMAAILVAAPAVASARLVPCHDAMTAHEHTIHGAVMSEVAVTMHIDHGGIERIDAKQGSSHPHDPRNCCGSGCLVCTAVIANEIYGVSIPSVVVCHTIDADLPIRGQALAPPIGPPRFQA